MARDFKLTIVAPDRTVTDENVVSVMAPGVEGYLGILAGHESLITELTDGAVTYRLPNNTEKSYAITGGFLEVSGESAIILADSAELVTGKSS